MLRLVRKTRKIYPTIILALPLPMLAPSGRQGENEGVHEYPSPIHAPIQPNQPDIIAQPAQQHNLHQQPDIQPPDVPPYIPWKYISVGAIVMGSTLIGSLIFDKYKSKNNLTEKMLELVASKNNMVEILVLGKSGVGKSYLINALIGKDVDIESNESIVSSSMKTKSFDVDIEIQSYKIATLKIWDTIGFYPDFNEKECITELQKAKNSGIILLVIDGNSPRLYDDIERICPILNKLYNGKSWINRTIIVATRGNQFIDNYSQQQLDERMEKWRDGVSEKLMKIGLSQIEANSIPLVWSFGKDNDKWKQKLITKFIERSDDNEKEAMEMIDIVKNNTDFKLQWKTALIF